MKHLLFLTGRLAETGLRKILTDLTDLPFRWTVHEIGLQVAGLMTAEMLKRRLHPALLEGVDEVIVPGRCRGDLDALSAAFGVPFLRGPDEMKDLPLFFGRGKKPADLSRHSVQIFAEIVDAPKLTVDEVLRRAERYRQDGADVIDIGTLPDTPFSTLKDIIVALKTQGFVVSVDSLHPKDLLLAGENGADYLLSLDSDTLWVAKEVPSTPVLIPKAQGDLDSLIHASETLSQWGRDHFVDAILDPIHYGFTESIVRFHALRRALPETKMLMGVGNLTELTDADTTGINALLFGIISELNIAAVLATEVSPHCRSAVREADAARRMMFAAKADNALPRDYSAALLTTHARRPFLDSPEDIRALADQVKDPNFRIQVGHDGLYAYNREGLRHATEPYAFWPQLGLERDASHAFYMGVELARAHHAYLLGKRYQQDEDLDWGAALPAMDEDRLRQKAEGLTLTHKLRDPSKGQTSDDS